MTETILKMEINSLPKNVRTENFEFIKAIKKREKKKSDLKKRKFGFAKGKIFISKDFNEPLDIFNF